MPVKHDEIQCAGVALSVDNMVETVVKGEKTTTLSNERKVTVSISSLFLAVQQEPVWCHCISFTAVLSNQTPYEQQCLTCFIYFGLLNDST